MRIVNRESEIEDRKRAEREIRTLCAMRFAVCRSAIIGENLRLITLSGLGAKISAEVILLNNLSVRF